MDRIQRGVAQGMALAVGMVIGGFALALLLGPAGSAIGSDLQYRLALAGWSVLAPVVILAVCVARLARHRFFTPEDIQGSGLSTGTDRARLLQAVLQNTLEQACIAVAAYFAAAMIVPASFLALVPAAALMFVVGRVLFLAGYAQGAPSRAFGFALTFYSSVLLIAVAAIVALI